VNLLRRQRLFPFIENGTILKIFALTVARAMPEEQYDFKPAAQKCLFERSYFTFQEYAVAEYDTFFCSKYEESF
jgi:hypothetical protein